jgi:HNH endonuclease
MSMRALIEARSERVPEAGCWIWIGSTVTAGYGDMKVAGRHVYAHRASYEAFVGPIPDGLHVLHRCDVRSCVNPHHLMLGTNKDNIHDCCRKGRNGRLSLDQVAAIRAERAAGCSVAEIANKYGVSQGHVSKLSIGKARFFASGPRVAAMVRYEPSVIRRALEMCRAGSSIRAAAKSSGMTFAALWKHKQKDGQ